MYGNILTNNRNYIIFLQNDKELMPTKIVMLELQMLPLQLQLALQTVLKQFQLQEIHQNQIAQKEYMKQLT